MFYDHQTESLWSQLQEKAISGPRVGEKLNKLPSIRTKWKTWRERHPDTLVLSTKTGYSRDYARDPYTGYYRAGTIWFPVGDVREDLSAKERILGIEVRKEAMAYPLSHLQKHPGIVRDSVGGEPIQIEVTSAGEVVSVLNQHGEELPHIFVYWFAWQAFHPDTKVFRGEK